MDIGRSMIKAFIDTPKSTPHNNDRDEQSGRIGANSRHRLGISPVRVRRSVNYDCVPMAVVTPSPPMAMPNYDCVPMAIVTPTPPIAISTRPIASLPHANSAKVIGQSQHRYISLGGLQNGLGGGSCLVASSALSRRSFSSIGATGLGLGPRKLDYDGFEDVKPLLQQQQRFERAPSLGGINSECQVPSNSILTLHQLQDDAKNNLRQPRDDSQERRLKELETRLREIEMRMVNSSAFRQRNASEIGATNTNPKLESFDIVRSAPPKPLRTSTGTPNSQSAIKGDLNGGILSVPVPPMTFDSGIFRVQPTPRAEAKAQRDVERLEKKLKNQEETAESLRAQHFKQIEQLTRQLAANDDVTQTLRSRIRELETENELWQNRFRLYNDVDVAKILRENERLRERQRRRSSRGEEEEKTEFQRKKEQVDEENEKLRARCNELDEKYQAAKEKYKNLVKASRNRRRQDHIEVESLKVTIELQNAELDELKRFVEQYGIAAEAPPPTVTSNNTMSDAQFNTEFVNYNLAKCDGIAECLSKVCTRIKRQEPLDPEDVLDYGVYSDANMPGAKIPKAQCDGKSMDEKLETLANKMTTLHSQVVDLYGDDLANSVSCNVQ